MNWSAKEPATMGSRNRGYRQYLELSMLKVCGKIIDSQDHPVSSLSY